MQLIIESEGADRTFYLYAGAQLISEFEDASSNTYSAGTTPGAAPADTSCTMLYQHSDHLTTRLTTDNFGNLSNEQAHYPYGEQWFATGTADPSVLRKFTSYQREDEATNGKLNYAVFREQSARNGRFLMADPKRGKAGNPQRLNRYAYVTGNPVTRTDVQGLDDTELVDSGVALLDLGSGIATSSLVFWVSDGVSITSLPDSKVGGIIGQREGIVNGYTAANQWMFKTSSATQGPVLPPGIVQVGPGQISYLPQAPAPQTVTGTTLPNGNVHIDWDKIVDYGRKVLQYQQQLQDFQKGIFTNSPSTPISLREGGSRSLATTTFSCSLQAQNGASCSYSCSSAGSFALTSFGTLIETLRTGCPGAGSLSQCPNTVQLSGLAGSTPDASRIASCTP